MAWKILGWLLIVAVVLTAALAGVGYYLSTVESTPQDPRSNPNKRVEAFDDDSITLVWDSDTAVPGRHALLWDHGHAYLGDQLSTTGTVGNGTVDYQIKEVTRGGLSLPLEAVWYWSYYEGTPQGRGLDYRTVTPSSDVGDLPSWYVPGDGDTWVIAVHGRNGDRTEALRVLRTLARQAPTLVIRYRNDPGIPTRDNLLRFGDTEWLDVQAAMSWARERGARRFVLYGFSSGAAICLQTLDRATGREDIAGLVLDAPVLDWRAATDQAARSSGWPAIVSWATSLATELRLGIDFDDFDWVARAAELDVPILIFHGTGDQLVPWEPSRDLAEARPDIVTLETFEPAGHGESWNIAPKRYEKAVAKFLTGVVSSGRAKATNAG